jgi:hypothetical protein
LELKAAQRQGLRDVVEKHLGSLTIEPGHLLDLSAIDQQSAADPEKELPRQSGLPMGQRALGHDRLAAGGKDARVIPAALGESDAAGFDEMQIAAMANTAQRSRNAAIT